MLNEPDIQPNAVVNWWIQGILMFDFALIHVPATHHKAADALSQRALGEGEEVILEDDSWLDDVALFTGLLQVSFRTEQLNDNATQLRYNPAELPSVLGVNSRQDQTLRDIFKFLTTLEAPEFPSAQECKRFIKKATHLFVQNEHMYKRQKNRSLLHVILQEKRQYAILLEAYEHIGHCQEQATRETV